MLILLHSYVLTTFLYKCIVCIKLSCCGKMVRGSSVEDTEVPTIPTIFMSLGQRVC